MTYFLKYGLAHLGCKKHQKIHLRQVGNVALWVDDNAHGAQRSGQHPPDETDEPDDVEVVEVDSDGETLDAAEAVAPGSISSDGPDTMTYTLDEAAEMLLEKGLCPSRGFLRGACDRRPRRHLPSAHLRPYRGSLYSCMYLGTTDSTAE